VKSLAGERVIAALSRRRRHRAPWCAAVGHFTRRGAGLRLMRSDRPLCRSAWRSRARARPAALRAARPARRPAATERRKGERPRW